MGEQTVSLERCMTGCQFEAQQMAGGPACSQTCADNPPKLDWNRVNSNYKECKTSCQPNELLVQFMFQGGTASVLFVLAIVSMRSFFGGFLSIFGLNFAAKETGAGRDLSSRR